MGVVSERESICTYIHMCGTLYNSGLINMVNMHILYVQLKMVGGSEHILYKILVEPLSGRANLSWRRPAHRAGLA